MIRRLCVAALLSCCWMPSAHAADAAGALIERGAYLARVGDCVACHTAPKGKPYAGGLAMSTPVGAVYSTNITPDPRTGIGTWTLRDFERALRHGVSRDGHNLYPAMPYPSYAKVRDEDVAALYAYFMRAVPAVKQANRESDIRWPLNMRWPLKLWNLAFLDQEVFRDNAAQSATWNRGAYLTQGLGHCGACHTSRGAAFQEKALDERGDQYLQGAALEGWYASSLGGDRRAGLGRWNEQDLRSFLRTGANRHATAFGSMTDVINNSTQHLTDADTQAIAHYLKSLPTPDGAGLFAAVPVATSAQALSGARVYGKYCLQCHGADGRGVPPLLAPLALNPNLAAPRTASLINVTLNGTRELVIGGLPAPYPMPAFGKVLSDAEVADVVTYLRGQWGQGADPMSVSADEVRKLRKTTRR
ncbi:c-type cytochrome [Duganella aceris]|nr:cytochrome c [Duganella aceris]